mmetsp:Transcript_5281/g.7775  ORF Transcript_5281/g.7775 Transcript_5281/m.7775 type:complete len:958 (-) Transcript_5281:152-3025(-)|eukprot:CAMPEP_0167754844 /NCGR_PEP_ID=MMETSP0110_2-20121227/8496_1 /TAXON_ID=629695 /ORGANISM="Gymnochlora sp., Strain CCMP2014" /LENGTH=957 /DNA_ID=CAMNT_0007640769 /DNA_START=83 /DNA_END=2956 /DNA_ORIENTATION=-
MTDSKKWTAKRVRETFVDFFTKKKKHTHWPSSSVVPYDDPTLLFANAGMNQYKAIFLGQADPKTDLGKLKRAANSQKCIRAGGKHNDLEDVGKDVYHHTFFEMLGNWSFGDYFKEDAIGMAWELLTEVYGVDSKRLYATYFGGDESQGLKPDLEAKEIWLKYLPKERVLPYGMKDNFWEMGATGPCGPCTEIHYDRIGNRFVPERVNADFPDVVEIWNLVFIQFNREPDKSLRQLPAKSVDTGMGFERLTSVLQDVDSNYDTDIFSGIFSAIQKECGCGDYTKKVGKDDTGLKDMAYRVVADHIRTLTFAITDGAAPGPNGRDSVLRSICRRAIRYGKEKLGAPPLFFNKLVPAVVEGFGEAYPELKKNPERVQEIILGEEKLFTKTLDKGIKKFLSMTKELKKGDTIPGKDCADLLTTYGFPVDLTTLMAEEKDLKVDEKGFADAMEKHAKISAQGGTSSGGVQLKLLAEQVAALKKKGISVTDDSSKYTWTSTGSGPEGKGVIKAIYLGKMDFDEVAKTGVECGIVMNTTNFYAEQGGQIFDIGSVKTKSGEFEVTGCQVAAGYVLHTGKVISGEIKVGEETKTSVDFERRALVAKNHTATHLLNYGLREVLKKEVEQKGSLVLPERLRFDFSADKGLKPDQIESVQKAVASMVEKKLVVDRRKVRIADAKEINGLRAIFAEKYPDPVTVVSVGSEVETILKSPKDAKWMDLSIEFCGGTHIANSSEIGAFVVMTEESIQAGTRRIVAYTNKAAVEALARGESLLKEAKSLLELKDLKQVSQAILSLDSKLKDDIPLCSKNGINKIQTKLVKLKKKLKKEGMEALTKVVLAEAKKLEQELKESKAKFCVAKLNVAEAESKLMSQAIKALAKSLPEVAIMLMSEERPGGKMSVMASVPKAIMKKFPAGTWVKQVLAKCGGRGGGKPNFAQGASKDSKDMEKAFDFAKIYAEQKIPK